MRAFVYGESGYPSKRLGQWCLVLFFGASGKKGTIDILMGFELLTILLKLNVYITYLVGTI